MAPLCAAAAAPPPVLLSTAPLSRSRPLLCGPQGPHFPKRAGARAAAGSPCLLRLACRGPAPPAAQAAAAAGELPDDGVAAGGWESEEEVVSRATLIWRAAKLPIYSVALVPLTCPPFRLGYQGLGEPLCFSAFGPFATTAFYLSQGCKCLSGAVLSASILVGLTTTLILFCSHFHQIEEDRAIGKMSPLVRIGTGKGSEMVKVAILTLYTLLFSFSTAKALPLTCTFICALTLPVGKLVADYVEKNHKDKVRIFMAKYYCVRLHSLFGISLALGLVLARTGANIMFPSLSVA